MTKKEIITPLIVLGLTVLFAGICLLVFLSNGKSKKWVAHKMKIGGMLLSFTAITFGSGCTTCYKPPHIPRATFLFDNINDTSYQIEINLDTGNTLTGILLEQQSSVYSFAIDDTLEQTKQKGLIIPIDGQIDSPEEKIKLEIDTNLTDGLYSLKIFKVDIAEQENTYPIDFRNLYLKHE